MCLISSFKNLNIEKDKIVKRKSEGLDLTLKSSRPPPNNRLCHPPNNFYSTSRGPTIKCHTFLETSHDPLLELQLIGKNLANFCKVFCNSFLQREKMRFKR